MRRRRFTEDEIENTVEDDIEEEDFSDENESEEIDDKPIENTATNSKQNPANEPVSQSIDNYSADSQTQNKPVIEPTKQPNNSSSANQNNVRSMVRDDVKSKLKNSRKNNKSSSHPTPMKGGGKSGGSLGIKLPKHSKNKKAPSKSKPQKKNSYYCQLHPINMSPDSMLFPFNSIQMDNLLSDYQCDMFIISVCNPLKTPEQNMRASLLLQNDIIKNDYLYIPIYVVDRGNMADLLFIVLSLGIEPKNPKAFPNFITLTQRKFNVSSYVYLSKGKFYLYSGNNIGTFKTNIYSDVIFYYSNSRGIKVSENKKLYANPIPTSKHEQEFRCSRKELCIESPKEREHHLNWVGK